MKLPQSRYRPAIVLKIFECHSHDIHGQSLWKFPSMLRVEAKSMLLQLRLQVLTSTTIFAIHRRFHDHARRTLVRSLRNLHRNITVYGVHTYVLQKCLRNMKNLKFAPCSWCVGRYKDILRPGKNDRYRNLLWNDVRDWDVLSGMPIIGSVRLKGQTLAEVFGRRLQETEILAAAAQGS